MRLALLTVCLASSVVSCVPSRDLAARESPPGKPAASSRTPTSSAATDGASISPSPVVSRRRRLSGASLARYAKVDNAFDGDKNTAWAAGTPTAEHPAWLAVDVGRGPVRLLLSWSSSGSFNYDETDYGSPGAYRIETSADSTDGENGSWTPVVDVPSVRTHGAAHAFPFAGRRWVRLVVTAAPAKSPNGVQIDEIAIHDASSGAQDTWFFMGDSITAFAFGRSVPRGLGFADQVHERHRSFEPVVVNGGIGSEKTDEGIGHLDAWLATNPDVHFWGIGYGTNDAAGDGADATRFGANLRTLVGRLKAAGRVPILASIPYATDGQHPSIPRFNEVIETVRLETSLPPGPDLYAWFSQHPDELRDGLHPNEKGIASINRLWAAAVDGLYGR